MTDDELFTPLTPANPAAVSRRCPHPRAARQIHPPTGGAICGRCGHLFDAAIARRGRNNRARGNAIEREVGKRLGLRRVGQFGGPEDLMNDLFAAQVKSGGSFPERLWTWLKAVPVKAGQTALLVVTDAPGAGRRRRGVVVVDMDDWQLLHGRDAEFELPVDPYLEEASR